MSLSRSIKDLRAYRAGKIEKLEDIPDTDKEAPSSQSKVASSAAVKDCRYQQWHMLGPVLHIQRWYRQCLARRRVQLRIAARVADHEEEYRHCCAMMIQCLFRGYRVRQDDIRQHQKKKSC